MSSNKATVSFKNDWGEDLNYITIRHRRGNDSDTETEVTRHNVDAHKFIENFLEFEHDSSRDYWWIDFTTNDSKNYVIKGNFYCSIEDSDKGKVCLRIEKSTMSLYVEFPSSSNCTVSIYEFK